MESNTILTVIAVIIGLGGCFFIMEWIAKQFGTSLDELSKSNLGMLLTMFVLLPISIVVGVIGLIALPLYGLFAVGYFLFKHMGEQRELAERQANEAIVQQRREEGRQYEIQKEEKIRQKFPDAKQAVETFTREALERGQWVFTRFVEDTPISVPVRQGSVIGCTMDEDFPLFFDTESAGRTLNWGRDIPNPNLEGQIVVSADNALVPRASVWIPFVVSRISGGSYGLQPLHDGPMKFNAPQPVIDLTLIAGSLELGQKLEIEFSNGGEQSRSLVDGQTIITYSVHARTRYYLQSQTKRPNGWRDRPDIDWWAERYLFPVYALLFVARPA